MKQSRQGFGSASPGKDMLDSDPSISKMVWKRVGIRLAATATNANASAALVFAGREDVENCSGARQPCSGTGLYLHGNNESPPALVRVRVCATALASTMM
jgi:hypothetical protein